MRYHKKTGTIAVTADEMRRMFAHTDDYETAWFQGDVMAKWLQTEDACWDGMSAGNDFRLEEADDGYGIDEEWGPFHIWQEPGEDADEFARDLKEFLKKYPTVESVLEAQKQPDWPRKPSPKLTTTRWTRVKIWIGDKVWIGDKEFAAKDKIGELRAKAVEMIKEIAEKEEISDIDTVVQDVSNDDGEPFVLIHVWFLVTVHAKSWCINGHVSHKAWHVKQHLTQDQTFKYRVDY